MRGRKKFYRNGENDDAEIKIREERTAVFESFLSFPLSGSFEAPTSLVREIGAGDVVKAPRKHSPIKGYGSLGNGENCAAYARARARVRAPNRTTRARPSA